MPGCVSITSCSAQHRAALARRRRRPGRSRGWESASDPCARLGDPGLSAGRPSSGEIGRRLRNGDVVRRRAPSRLRITRAGDAPRSGAHVDDHGSQTDRRAGDNEAAQQHFARNAQDDEGAEHDAPADHRGAKFAVAIAQQPGRGVRDRRVSRLGNIAPSSAGSGPRKTKMRPICSESGPCKVCLSRCQL